MNATAIALDPAVATGGMRQRQWLIVLRSALRLWRTRLGLAILVLIVLIALLGPAIAPHGQLAFVAPDNSGPSSHALFGTDTLGRDVWSRFLDGGRSVLGLSVLSTLLGVSLGLLIGLTAAYAHGAVDEILMRVSDVFLSFPQILFALLLVAALGSNVWLLVAAVGITTAPRVARVMRGAALQVVERDFVKAAEAVGEKRRRIIFGELLPNVSSPLMVECGLRLTYSIGLIAALDYLGFGVQPPNADWGYMIYENQLAVTVQPWGVVLPVIAIGLLTIGAGLVTDGIARAAIGLDGRGSS